MRLDKLWLLRSSWGPRSVRRTRRAHPPFLQCRVSRSLAERAQGAIETLATAPLPVQKAFIKQLNFRIRSG
jgi:hypothetical protein